MILSNLLFPSTLTNSHVTWFFEFLLLTVLDSSSSFPSGFFEGTLSNLGDFDECIGIKYRNEDVDGKEISFDGKYFHFVTYLIDPCNKYSKGKNNSKLIDITETAIPELGLTTSSCLPSSCSNGDLFIMIQNGELSCHELNQTVLNLFSHCQHSNRIHLCTLLTTSIQTQSEQLHSITG